MEETHVYLAPGLLGFERLAGIDYFRHIRHALEQRFRGSERPLALHVVAVHPSASIRRRAERLVALVSETAGPGEAPIHLLGHSMGGLDVRLAASPSARLEEDAAAAREPWLARICSVTTMNSPHYGSPGMSFLATSQGQRVLYAVSALTVAGLTLGAPPLAMASTVIAALRGSRHRPELEQRLIDRLVERFQGALDAQGRKEVREWLHQIREDRGAIGQLTPEAMDLFQTSVEDRPGLRYQCTASYAPRPRMGSFLRQIRSPWKPISAALFDLLYRVTAVRNPQYPCSPPDGGEASLGKVLGRVPPPEANDGFVPLRSQLWGELVWAGYADHLDVMGYFAAPPEHRDWLASGARFHRRHFDEMMDRIVEGMWAGEAARQGGPDQYAV